MQSVRGFDRFITKNILFVGSLIKVCVRRNLGEVLSLRTGAEITSVHESFSAEHCDNCANGWDL